MTLSDFTREMSSSSSPFSNSLRLVASLHLPVDSSINEPFLGGRNRESRRGRRRNGWRREARPFFSAYSARCVPLLSIAADGRICLRNFISLRSKFLCPAKLEVIDSSLTLEATESVTLNPIMGKEKHVFLVRRPPGRVSISISLTSIRFAFL